MNGSLLCGACSLAIAVQALTAQTMTSPGHVLLFHSQGDGGTVETAQYEIIATFGHGPVAHRMETATYALDGGFLSAVDVDPTGAPLLSSVTPVFATMRGQQNLVLHGTELDGGAIPTVRIGDHAAVIQARQKDRITTSLPGQSTPGWQPVTVSNNLGTSVLRRGVGVLPLIEADPAPASGVPFSLVFRGTQGDSVIWALGFAKSVPLPLAGIHYGFALDPSAFVVFSGVGITNGTGEHRLPFPATVYATGTVYAQAMFSSANPGYGPATFSNVIRF